MIGQNPSQVSIDNKVILKLVWLIGINKSESW